MQSLVENLASSFVGLLILSLVVISLGFLWDSAGVSDEADETKPPSTMSRVVMAGFYLIMAILWTWQLSDDWSEPDRNWGMLVFCAVVILVCITEVYRLVKEAVVAHRTVDS